MAHKKANTKAIITLLAEHNNKVINLQPFVAVVMRESGCTFQEIATVLDCSYQNAERIVKRMQAEL